MARESCSQRNKVAPPPSVDALIAQLATRQHGLVTTAQLTSVGLDRSMITRWARRGRLHRVHRAVYAVGHRRLSREGRWMAAVLAAGDGAVLSHLSAAVLFNAWRRKTTGIHVTGRRSRRLDGVTVHRARHLDPRDTTIRHAIPVTTMARTLVDLTELLSAHQLANVIHEAAFRTHYDPSRTREAMTRAGGRRRLSILERAIALHESGSAGTRSDLEDRYLAHTTSQGLPEPLVNTNVHGLEVDFHWPDRRHAVEIDGSGHTRPPTRRQDEARDRTLTRAGFTVTRVAPS